MANFHEDFLRAFNGVAKLIYVNWSNPRGLLGNISHYEST